MNSEEERRKALLEYISTPNSRYVTVGKLRFDLVGKTFGDFRHNDEHGHRMYKVVKMMIGFSKVIPIPVELKDYFIEYVSPVLQKDDYYSTLLHVFANNKISANEYVIIEEHFIGYMVRFPFNEVRNKFERLFESIIYKMLDSRNKYILEMAQRYDKKHMPSNLFVELGSFHSAGVTNVTFETTCNGNKKIHDTIVGNSCSVLQSMTMQYHLKRYM